MTDKTSVIIQSTALVGIFFGYLSSGNPGFLVICLGIIGWILSYTIELINFNRTIYYVTLLGILLFQSIILINSYLFQMIYLQNNYQYGVLALGVMSYAVIIALLLKPNIIKTHYL